MPAGVTWGTYLKGVTAALLSMFAGAQAVHIVFRPLDDFQEQVDKRKAELRAEGVKPDLDS